MIIHLLPLAAVFESIITKKTDCASVFLLFFLLFQCFFSEATSSIVFHQKRSVYHFSELKQILSSYCFIALALYHA